MVNKDLNLDGQFHKLQLVIVHYYVGLFVKQQIEITQYFASSIFHNLNETNTKLTCGTGHCNIIF
jgi:hypothetical protein